MNFRDTSAQDTLLAPPPFWRRHRRLLIGGGLGLLALALLLPEALRLLGASASIRAGQLQIATVERATFVRDLAADGLVVAAVSPTLYASAAGTVKFAVHAGDTVRAGQVLGTVGSPELTNRLAEERATLQSLAVDYQRARIDAEKQNLAVQQQLEDARIDQITAARDLDRYARAYQMGAMPQIRVLKARDELAKANLALKHAKQDAGLDRHLVVFDVRSKLLARDRQQLLVADLQRQVDALTLRAPVTGQVGQLLVPDRSNVSKNAALLNVVDLSALEVQIQVPESFARDLASGMPAQISGDAQSWPGVVGAISPEVIDGQVAARVRFADGRPRGLRENQRLSVRVVLDHIPNALVVSRGPFADEGNGYAYVVHGDIAQRTPVRLGQSSISQVQILSGLAPGDRVVIAGSDAFRSAGRVVISR